MQAVRLRLNLSVNAGLTGNPDIALANVTGSNITIFSGIWAGHFADACQLSSQRDRQDIFWLTILTLAVSVMLLADILLAGGRIAGLCRLPAFFAGAQTENSRQSTP